MSHGKVEKPEELVDVGESVFCKVISLEVNTVSLRKKKEEETLLKRNTVVGTAHTHTLPGLLTNLHINPFVNVTYLSEIDKVVFPDDMITTVTLTLIMLIVVFLRGYVITCTNQHMI